MNPVDYNSRGLKSKTVCELLELNKQTLRYWAGVLYPYGRPSEYNSFEILLLRIVKEFVLWNRVQVSAFSGFSWEDFVEELSSYSFIELSQLVFYMNSISHEILLLKSGVDHKLPSRGLQKVKLNQIVNEHINSLIYCGTDWSNSSNSQRTNTQFQ